MGIAIANDSQPTESELPATAYPYYHQIFRTNGPIPTGLLFDSKSFAVMAVSHPADAEMPDLNIDKDGDRILIVIDGDMSLQIGESRFRLGPGDAVQIPRGAQFGKSRSTAGSHILLIRGKAMRSFAMYR